MAGIAQIVVIVTLLAGATGVMAYRGTRLYVYTLIIGAILFALFIQGALGPFIFLVGPLFILYAAIFHLPFLRRRFITRPILHYFQRVLPPMSETEKEAIQAGDVWFEGDIFSGHPNWQKWLCYPLSTLSPSEQVFLNHQTESLCAQLNDWEINQKDHDLPETVWNYLKEEKFFGIIIPKAYGGLGFSAAAHSSIVTKIATRSMAAAVTVMVPNSLGPAELLLQYGTDDQKNYYLPRLANGQEIPCFALTGPESGSDATNMSDTGVITKGVYQGKEIIGIRLNWDKRYITLAPVASLLGLAFKLSDPDHLLGEHLSLGITLCLIPTNTSGVSIGRRHNPLNIAFMNGPTQGKNVFVPLDFIIGGQAMIGKGWKMLVECLAAGRGISLPALSTAGGMLAYRATGAYARIRSQFNTPIGNFEGIQEALARIGGMTYQLEATRRLTVTAIDAHLKPAVITAIAKYHMTELCRHIMNDTMDIHAGKGIMMGPRNYIARGFQAIPVSITVEGANILTRNLIIFGQGAMRCHVFLREELEIISDLNLPEKEKIARFDKVLFQHIAHFIKNKVSLLAQMLTRGKLGMVGHPSMKKYYQQANWLSLSLAVVSDVTMLYLGGKLKRKERLSARLGDVLSQLYLVSCVLKYHYHTRESEADDIHATWAVEHAFYQAQQALIDFYQNFPSAFIGKMLKFLTFGFHAPFKKPSDKQDALLAKSMLKPSAFREKLTHLCFVGNRIEKDPLFQMEMTFNKMNEANILKENKEDSLKEIESLRKTAIQVDDFDNISIGE